MKYFVTDRNDDILGPHSEEEIASLLASGAIESTALCCKEGSDSWSTLESFMQSAPAASVEAKSASASAADVAADLKESVAPTHAASPPDKPETSPKTEPAFSSGADVPVRQAGANPILVLGVLLVLALILFGAYYLGSRL
jgi:hypothetical protein